MFAKPIAISLSFCVLLVNSNLNAKDIKEEKRLMNLAQELVTLRSDLEKLHDQIKNQEELYQSQLQTLNIQKADLSASIQRDELRATELEQQLDHLKQTMSENFTSSTELIVAINQVTKNLKKYVSDSMPFKKSERLGAIESLEKTISLQKKSPYKVANELWALVEDEIRLHRDLGLYKQVIKIDGKEQICEIAKIGMITFYYKTADGQYGMMKQNRKAQTWSPIKIDRSEDTSEIESIFDAFKKQIKYGPFSLPGLNQQA